MPSIRTLKQTIETFIETQSSAVNSLNNAVNNIQTDKNSATRVLDSNVTALVVADDAGRYSALTRAAEGQGANYNFNNVVANWTQQDEINRKERAELGEKWGTRQSVASKTAEIKANVELHDEALSKISPEIGQFDETTKAIRAHNEKYAKRPSVQITVENHDSFETLGGGNASKIKNFFKATWRLMQAAVGFLGPYRAVKVMSKYNKQYGDYFEDATDIGGLRENEKKIKADRAEHQKSYEQFYAIGSRMDTLDHSYKGPEGIAQGIRSLVKGLLLKSEGFVQGLLNELPGENAQAAALSTIKIAFLSQLESKGAAQLTHAESTLAQIRSPLKELSDAVGRVGSETVDFPTSTIEANIATASKTSRTNARNLNDASDAVDGYTAAVGTSVAEMTAKVQSRGAVQLEGNQLLLDFTSLERSVNSRVAAYEAEQARLRRIAEEEAAAARRRQQEINDAFAAASRVATRHSSPSVSSSDGFSIGGGGVSRSSGFSIGGGGRGISR